MLPKRAPPPPDDTWLRPLLASTQVSVSVIAAILAGFALWALRRILEPFALALFLFIMVDGLTRLLRARLPRLASRAAPLLAFVLVAILFGGAIWVTADNAADFAARAPSYTGRLNALLELGAARLHLHATPTLASLMQRLNPGRLAGTVATEASHFTEAAVFVLVYLGFLVASRAGFEAKTRALFTSPGREEEAKRVFGRVRTGVESYLWVQTLVGLMITGASAVVMALVGLSHIPFWCMVIFLANYIPAIGAAVGVLFPAAFGLVEFTELWRAALLIGALEAIHFVVSHAVQPRLQGRSLDIDPIVVLLALAFWGALWGLVGAFLSTPLTVTAMAVLAEFTSTRWIAVLLSSDGKPYGAARGPAAET